MRRVVRALAGILLLSATSPPAHAEAPVFDSIALSDSTVIETWSYAIAQWEVKAIPRLRVHVVAHSTAGVRSFGISHSKPRQPDRFGTCPQGQSTYAWPTDALHPDYQPVSGATTEDVQYDYYGYPRSLEGSGCFAIIVLAQDTQGNVQSVYTRALFIGRPRFIQRPYLSWAPGVLPLILPFETEIPA